MYADLIKNFIKIEESLDLYSVKIDDFQYWLYIRTSIFREIVASKEKMGQAFTKTSISIKDLPTIAIHLLIDKHYKINKWKGEYDVIFMSHPRRQYCDGKYTTIYTDSYAQYFKNSLTIEKPYQGHHFQPCLTENILYLDRLFYIRALINKLPFYNLKKEKISQIRKKIVEVSELVKNVYDYQLNVESVVKDIQFLYKRYRYTKKYFTRMLRIIRPKVIVQVVHYSFENMVMCEIANSNKINVIELQHGLIGQYHIAYNYGKITSYNIFPKKILTFSNFWSQSAKFPCGITIKATGFDYYEKMIKKYPPLAKRKNVLFLSSGTIGDQLVEIAVKLAELLKGSEYKIIFKLHPGEYDQWKSRYKSLLYSNITVIDNAETSLYYLFSKSCAQVGVYSTALFEGLGYDLNTFILRNSATEHVSFLIENGYATLVENANDIVKCLKNIQKQRYDSSFFWKPNAFISTCQEIQEALNHR